MKYLKPPMLSMNFLENKTGMKKRLFNILYSDKKYSGKICFGLILCCVAVIGGLVGCSSNEVSIDNDKLNGVFWASDLESAVSYAILANNTGRYLKGEATAEGHIILDQVTNQGKDGSKEIIVYALTSYGEYGFENGIFTKVSGTGIIPVKVTYEKNDKGYNLVEYRIPLDGSEYEKSIREMFPDNLEDRALRYSDQDAEKCYEQEYQYANCYLTTIGRKAEVNLKVDKELPNMNVYASNTFIDLYHDYPYWIGTQEKMEHNTRYVYEKLWEDKGNGDGIVTFKKYRYEDNFIIEEYVIEIKEGRINYLKGEPRTIRDENSIAKEIRVGSEVSVDLDGDGKTENVYYGLDDFRINDISYKNEIEDVYMNNPDSVSYIVADIDKSDKQKEIVLKVEGPSDDPVAYFYTYKNGLIKLESAETSINYMSFDGEGNIYGNVRLNILQTWWAPETWSLKHGKIVRNTDHIYYPNQYIGNELILNEELPIHEKLTDSKQPTIMEPQKVRITATDNKGFCYIEGEDGMTGWFSVTNFYNIVELNNKPADEVFTGLCMAD